MPLLVAAVVVLVVAVAVTALAVRRLTRLRLGVEDAWRHLDSALEQRHEVVDALIAAVAPLEVTRETTDRVAEARADAALPGAPPPVQAHAEQTLVRSVDQLLVQVDADPDVAADAQVKGIRQRLLAADARILERHRAYDLASAELAAALDGRLGHALGALAGVVEVEPYDPGAGPPDDRVEPERI
ncbi:MAG TPA: LemA family protein [Jiangellales bacterium]|nr:LemA family protein [Jiangellales bacterium]